MRDSQRGLTLAEMLVALSVFGLIALTCLLMLRLSINSDEQLNRTSQMVTEFQIARTLIKADLAQITQRQVRNEIGEVMAAPLIGGAYSRGNFVTNDQNETLLLAMISNGRINPGDIYPQSSLQYIEYRLVEDKILRRVWTYLDRLQETPHSEQVLFKGLKDVSIRFLDGTRWTDQWQSRAGVLAPRALQLEFAHPLLGPVNQIFYIEGVAG